jgi:hypothetical protein
MKLADEARDFLQSTLLPSSKQSPEQQKKLDTKPCAENTTDSPITSNLVAEKGACQPDELAAGGSGGGSNPTAVLAAATKAGIPGCVLDAVYNIESSRGATSSCTPNACGAVGPFAITVGYTGKSTGGQCSKDTDCSKCPAGYCPNALKENLSGYTAADMCDTGKAAEAAASLLKGKAGAFNQNLSGSNANIAGSQGLQDAIIYAGNAYFGSNYTFTTGDNIEPGCSYGESILKKYCGVSTYTCGSRNHPVNNASGN